MFYDFEDVFLFNYSLIALFLFFKEIKKMNSNTDVINDDDKKNKKKKQRAKSLNTLCIFKPSTSKKGKGGINDDENEDNDVVDKVSNNQQDSKQQQEQKASISMNVDELNEIKRSWKVGTLVEARDLQDNWYKSRIIQIDDTNKRCKVHFFGWNSRYDQWFDLYSNDLRPINNVESSSIQANVSINAPSLDKSKSLNSSNNSEDAQNSESFNVGDKVLAQWTDKFYYGAIVTRIIEKNHLKYYEVKFEDGVKKQLRYIYCKKYVPELDMGKRQALTVTTKPTADTELPIIEPTSTELSATNEVSMTDETATSLQPTESQVSSNAAESVANDAANVRKSTRVKRKRTFSNDEIELPLLARRQLSTGANKKAKLTIQTYEASNENASNSPKPPSLVLTNDLTNRNVNEKTSDTNVIDEAVKSVQNDVVTSKIKIKNPIANYFKTLSLFKANNRKRVKSKKNIEEEEQEEEQVLETTVEECDETITSTDVKQINSQKSINEQTLNNSSDSFKFQVNKLDQTKEGIKLKISKLVSMSSISSSSSLAVFHSDHLLQSPLIQSPNLLSSSSSSALLTPLPLSTSITPSYMSLMSNASSTTSTCELIKCKFANCNKTFRKQHLLDYHIKYHHYEDGRIIEPVTKKRKLTNTSIVSNENESVNESSDVNTVNVVENVNKRIKLEDGGVEKSKKAKKTKGNNNNQQVIDDQNDGDPYEVIHCKCGKNLSIGFMIQVMINH